MFRYEEKRWVPRNGQPKSPPRRHEEKASISWQRPEEKTRHNYASNSRNSFEERKSTQAPNAKESVPATRIAVPAPPQGPQQV